MGLIWTYTLNDICVPVVSICFIYKHSLILDELRGEHLNLWMYIVSDFTFADGDGAID
jgi:hypothetical protein